MKMCPACRQWNTAWDTVDEIYRCLHCGISFADDGEDDYDLG